MVKKFRFSDKEYCPCESGDLYRDCCKKKPPKQFHNNDEALNHTAKMLKKSRRKLCMFEGCTAKPKEIIEAHALQENWILYKLATDRKVLMQDFRKKTSHSRNKER